MNKLEVKFIKSGMHTLVQDLGRPGKQEYGVPIGGALDRQSAKNANILVGNSMDTPVLEITMIGPEILFSTDCHVAITGADISPEINLGAITNNQLYAVQAGSTLKFGQLKSGCRAYLAIAGKWEVKTWLESASASTWFADQLTPDSIIKKDHILQISPAEAKVRAAAPITIPTLSEKMAQVRVTAGPEFEWFPKEAIAYFFSRGHQISADSNRMGYKLATKIKGITDEKEMISSGIVPGTVQITPENKAIVLLADAQTTGGYPRIANIINSDLDKLAQMKPGEEIWFSLVL